MAGETGTQGSEFPIFKSGEGAFDRAKFKEQESAMITPGGQLTGKEIDEDLKKKKKSADDVIKEANKFYNDEYKKNLKALDPAYDPSIIYYSESYSRDSSDRSEIDQRIEDGEALDGKEISEMAKGSAQNKVANAQKLKTGTVTQIVENLGLRNIKEYEKYDSVKEEFDSKVKDDKLKFEPMLDKISKLLSFFNDNGPMAGQNHAILYTTENKAILAALAKILEGEGFNNDNIKKAAESYDKHMLNLIEKDKGGSIESMKMTKEGDVVAATGPTGAATETKLAEKTSTTGPQPSSIESVANTTGSTGGTTGPAVASAQTKLEETKNNTGTTGGTTGTAVSSAETKLAETKNITGATGTVNSEPAKIDTSNRESKVNSMLKSLFGIDSGASGGPGGTGGTGGTGDSKAKTETEKLAEKKAEDITGAPKGVTGSTGGTENKEPEKKNEETKLENKIDNKNEKVNETLPVSTGKIETTTQNLSSVSTMVEKPKEPEPNTATTTNTTTSNTSSNTGSSGSTTTEVPKSETTNNEKKVEGNKTEGEGNKEMLDTMKTISALLVQLNSTMQGPLIVTSTNKKFQ